MLKLFFFIYNIFVMTGGLVFPQTIGIAMGTNCTHFQINLFIYSYEIDYMHELVMTDENIALSYDFMFHYMMSFHCIITNFVIMLIASISLNLK
jgi:hypothetical protein